jgi:hypothetical protein
MTQEKSVHGKNRKERDEQMTTATVKELKLEGIKEQY